MPPAPEVHSRDYPWPLPRASTLNPFSWRACVCEKGLACAVDGREKMRPLPPSDRGSWRMQSFSDYLAWFVSSRGLSETQVLQDRCPQGPVSLSLLNLFVVRAPPFVRHVKRSTRAARGAARASSSHV